MFALQIPARVLPGQTENVHRLRRELFVLGSFLAVCRVIYDPTRFTTVAFISPPVRKIMFQIRTNFAQKLESR